ncbi:phage portal protein [Glutamicibacter halophytocola]|uniref:phage portal protein n=1 Tax=Glutamicibacter halophytocola TaxID=1933880 RepID=UPI0015C57379|nr:phage portal protein [Glutamicibacter halophytocola]NQD40559.1 phage portal protein [Glutamicibacter halophytocola]
MGMFSSFIDRFALGRAASIVQRSEMLPGIKPPVRSSTVATPENATSLHSVYRAVEILLNAGAQLSIDSKRSGIIIPEQPAILRRPSLDDERDDFIEETLMSLILDGNMFWLRRQVDGKTIAVEALNPFLVGVNRDPKTGRKYFQYQGKEYSTAQIIHRTRMKLPGQLRGRSVIQAAREDMEAALKTRQFAGGVFDDHRIIDGILTSEQALTGEDAKKARYAMDRRDIETGEPLDDAYASTLRVLGKGMSFESLTLHPKDAQWLESQSFNVTVVARMFGVPASLMLATLEGNSQTYANVEQDWIGFVRFTLSGYLRKIESAFTELLPHGQAAKFNVEGLLRSDTLTRYKAHAMAIGKWALPQEIRAIENMPPLTDEELEELKQTETAPQPIPVENQQ